MDRTFRISPKESSLKSVSYRDFQCIHIAINVFIPFLKGLNYFAAS